MFRNEIHVRLLPFQSGIQGLFFCGVGASGKSGAKPKPAGLIKTLGASGIETEGGGRKTKTDHALGESRDCWISSVLDFDDVGENAFLDAIKELKNLVGEDASKSFLESRIAELERRGQELKAQVAKGSPGDTRGKGSPGKRSKCLPPNAKMGFASEPSPGVAGGRTSTQRRGWYGILPRHF